jgi:hypothetical protein
VRERAEARAEKSSAAGELVNKGLWMAFRMEGCRRYQWIAREGPLPRGEAAEAWEQEIEQCREWLEVPEKAKRRDGVMGKWHYVVLVWDEYVQDRLL